MARGSAKDTAEGRAQGTANYKGVEVAAELAGLIRHMPGVDETREALQRLQGVWDTLSMLGQLSGTGVEIAGVRSAFTVLTARLLDQLGAAARRKVGLELQTQAQVAINILIRNLFERTADIGFLATDGELRRYAENDAAGRDADRSAIRDRLREYQRKYTVYDDIVLLDTAGRPLVRLDERGATGAVADAFVAESLATSAAYVEHFGRQEAFPGDAPVLSYAYRVPAQDGRRAVGVLALRFGFADECRRIFAGLRRRGDWSVLALLDAAGTVIASSDPLQVPLGAAIGTPPGQVLQPRRLRFGGRPWLAITCAGEPYQGYAGPGWYGHAMVPLEHAFALEDEADEDRQGGAAQVEPELLHMLTSSPLIFPQGLREIPRAAEAIEAELRRAVWNGNVRLSAEPGDAGHGFAKTLLGEIGATGARTRDVFTAAIADINQSVISAVLDDAASRAALAVDILDRNLYERANDCRWWALMPGFRAGLESPVVDAATSRQLGAALQAIHALYTVYANLLLFDRDGTVVAVSRVDGEVAPGLRLDAEWVRRTLALPDAQAYAVAAFEPSVLYGGRHAAIYTAAIRGSSDTRRVVGGIAIVFDAEPQFRAMLDDTLPRGEAGAAAAGAFNLFVDAGGRVLARSQAEPLQAEPLQAEPSRAETLQAESEQGEPAIGETLDAGVWPALATAADGARVLSWRGRLHAVGSSRSTGYREYKGPHDAYRHDVVALTFLPLADAADPAGDESVPTRRGAASPAGARAGASAPGNDAPATRGRVVMDAARRLDLATFEVAGQWYALAAADVVEALGAQRILPLPSRPAHVRGSVMHGGMPVLVLDLARLLDGPPGGSGGDIVIVRAAPGRPGFGLLVDALGDNPTVDRSRLEPLAAVGAMGDSLVEQLVKGDAERRGAPLLKLLSLPRIAGIVFGTRTMATA